MYDVAIQAAIGGNIIARGTSRRCPQERAGKMLRRDISRKRKLLEKQKAGKKRMKQIGSVEVPQEAFLPFCKSKTEPHAIDECTDRNSLCRLVAYLGGWYTGYWSGNFSLLLFF